MLEYIKETQLGQSEQIFIPEEGKLSKGLESLDLQWGDIFCHTFPEIGNIRINQADLGKVISLFNDNSSPGPSTENKKLNFLLFSKIPNILTAICQTLLDNQTCTGDFGYLKTRSIVMIQKNSNRKPAPKDYRPISLLEILYKILAKLLLYRVKEVIPKIVGVNQFEFYPTAKHVDLLRNFIASNSLRYQSSNSLFGY